MCMWKVRILHRVCYVSVSASCDTLFIPLSDDTLELKQTEKQARKKNILESDLIFFKSNLARLKVFLKGFQ